MLIILILAGLLIASSASARPLESPAEQRMIRKIDRAWPERDEWKRIAQCETGGDWQWDSGTFQGGLGFYYGSWDSFRLPGYPREAYNATMLQQMMVGEEIYDVYGLSGWGCRGWA